MMTATPTSTAPPLRIGRRLAALLGALAMAVPAARAGDSLPAAPWVGAQVFIEPGQPPERIDGWFRLMREQGLSVCRIRMFETYLRKPDGSWDFSQFDHAFEAADRHGVKILGTLFPATPFTDVGGFKFPRTAGHQREIAEYIRATVGHFKRYESSLGWVLVNEPGCGQPPDEPLTRSRFDEWLKRNPPVERNAAGYPVMGFERERFLLDHNIWYLDWLAGEVRRLDPQAHVHVNNHGIFSNVAEYDFPRWRPILDSLGGSAHASWHFRHFSRPRFVHAMAANCEILRAGAGEIPWLMTELQGGNNTYSGSQPLCPTAEEITQWLWIVFASGGKGSIFWSLNPRASGFEAGEWALVDFLDRPSDRLRAAGAVARAFTERAGLLGRALPVDGGIDVLYTRESLWVEKTLQTGDFPLEGRQFGGVIKSALGWFETLGEMGVNCGFREIGEYDFERPDFNGRTIILAHQVAIPAKYRAALERFVERGGKLVVEGLSGYYDEQAHCVMATEFPFARLFGGRVREFKLEGQRFDFQLTAPELRLPAHGWRGVLQPDGGTVIAHWQGEPAALRNRRGAGEVLWLPTQLGIAARNQGGGPLCRLLETELAPSLATQPLRFRQRHAETWMRTLQTGDSMISVMVHKGAQPLTLDLAADAARSPNLVFADKGGKVTGPASVLIHPEETLVIEWRR